MDFNWVIILLLVGLISIFAYKLVTKPTSKVELSGKPNSVDITLRGNSYNLEIANTNAQREKGLMNRSSMAKDSGMIFVFDVAGIYPFWMKNTLITLDIIWLDQNGKVVFIKENAGPCSNIVSVVCHTIIPNAISKYVIELNSGEVEKIGLKVGDSVEIPSL